MTAPSGVAQFVTMGAMTMRLRSRSELIVMGSKRRVSAGLSGAPPSAWVGRGREIFRHALVTMGLEACVRGCRGLPAGEWDRRLSIARMLPLDIFGSGPLFHKHGQAPFPP